jgi:FlaA1/EpsC-like NDP-sugar epimerase
MPPIRNRHFLAADVLLMALAAATSFVLRLDVAGTRVYATAFLLYVLLSAVIKPFTFFLFGIYGYYWPYAGTREALTLWMAALVGAALTTLALSSGASLVLEFRPLPRSIPVIDWLVSFLVAGGVRLLARGRVRHRIPFLGRRSNDALKSRPESQSRVLVMGAGEAGAMIVREMQENPGVGLDPVGFLDDDLSKVGLRIHGIPVLGPRESIPRLVEERLIDELIIAMPTAPGQAIRGVVEICHKVGLPCRTMPGVYELISGRVSVDEVREVGIDDLLRRDAVEIDGQEAGRYLRDAVVLITGAGGSIGSELCRQIAAYKPKRLLVLGHGENSIYHILREIEDKFPHIDARPVIADIRHRHHLNALFRRHRPDAVFHAAAHKHVPLMEQNVAEAVTNNILGTQALLEASREHGVERFVLISTDKAVNPVNVMGATKRMAELLVQASASRTGNKYVVVRFGNVLGSRGSVVPLFQQQISKGGPITVTHPEMERYFMTMPEAVQLVLQAGALGTGGEIFVLDMGRQVRIVDLAEQLIKLSGLEPGRDIEIVFTQPRPGEKLSEELFAAGEQPHRTVHDKILVAERNHLISSDDLAQVLRELRQLARNGSAERLLEMLEEVVPEYRPDPPALERKRKRGEGQTGGRRKPHA